jgi:hypothetical protein
MALDALPDHLLRDIGLSRGQIDRAVTQGRAVMAGPNHITQDSPGQFSSRPRDGHPDSA